MNSNLITRHFPNSVFVLDLSSQSSFFIEGTTSKLVPFLLNDINYSIPSNFWLGIPMEYINQAQQDVEELRNFIKKFLKGLNRQDCCYSEKEEESPMRKLSAYAVKNWQIVNVSIEMTYYCNLRCKWCYLESFSLSGLSRQKLLKIADQLKNIGAIFVLFTGGEVFSRKDALDIMKDYRDMGFAIEVKSNGLFLNQVLVNELANLNLFNFQISIYDIKDSLSPLTAGRYQFSRLAKNIKEAVSVGLPVSLTVLVGKHNINDLFRYNDILSSLGVNEIFYSPYITPNRNGSGKEVCLRLSRKEMDEKLYPFLNEIGGFISPFKYRDKCKNTPVCYAGRDQIAINPRGLVYPCLDFRLPLGDLEAESLMSILERRQSKLSNYLLRDINKCWQCSISEFCDSCIGMAMVENKCFSKPSSHKCDVSKFYYDFYLRRKEKCP